MAKIYNDKEDLIDIQNVFRYLDKNNDGKLSKKELTDGFERIYS